MAVILKHRSPSKTKRGSGAELTATVSSASPVASLRTTLAMPRARFARLLGRTERAVIDWESGKSQP